MQRARRTEDKEARAAAIEEAALALFREKGFAGLTMSDVALASGLAKGTLFLYFPTKEALGLVLVRRLLGEWFDDIDGRLGRMRPPASANAIARAVATTVDERPDMVALLALLGTLLEHNIDAPTAAAWKAWLLERMALTGALLEKVLPFLPQGGGMRLLVHAHALVVGLHQHAAPAPVVAEVLKAPELQALRIDASRELTFVLRALIEGQRP